MRSEHMGQLTLYTLMLQATHGSHNLTRPPSLSPARPSTKDFNHARSPSSSIATSHSSRSGNSAATPKPSSGKQLWSPGEGRSTHMKNATSKLGAGGSGVLLYLNDESFHARRIEPTISHYKALLAIRNELACNIKESEKPRAVRRERDLATGETSVQVLPAPPTKLPPIEVGESMCANCFSQSECMLYRRSELYMTGTEPTAENSPRIIHENTRHLTPAHLQYFHDWDRMLDLELAECNVNIVKSWLVPSEERELLTSRTVSKLEWEGQEMNPLMMSSGKELKTWVLRFKRDGIAPGQTPCTTQQSQTSQRKHSLTGIKIDKGDRVVLSTDHSITASLAESSSASPGSRHQLHIVKGHVHSIDDEHISLTSSDDEFQRLSNIWNNWNAKNRVLRFRIDADEFATSGGALRQNLIDLCKHDENKAFLRRMIVDFDKPRFSEINRSALFQAPSGASAVPGCDLLDLYEESDSLNLDQMNAVLKIVHAKDYVVVQGLPGTGKTWTMAYIIRLLVAKGMRVLVTSYTHAAVDNLLCELRKSGMGDGEGKGDVLRVGSEFSIDKNCHDIVPKRIALEKYGVLDDEDQVQITADALRRVMMDSKVVGVSCLTAPKSPLINAIGEQFDIVIVDEAGQITQPAILGGLGKASKFVLVGDHMQLPPLVRDEGAAAAGYNVSLLKRLAEKVPESIAQLTLQYRMHEHIVMLCNAIAYGGDLKCGNEQVRSSEERAKQQTRWGFDDDI